MARGEKDRPDPTLIIEGSRWPHPTWRIQGQDYPRTALEELQLREKGTHVHVPVLNANGSTGS